MAGDQQKGTIGGFADTNDLYKRMIEEIQDYAIILLDKDGIVRNWNKGAQQIKLYTEAEIIGKHFSTFYLPEDLNNNLPQILMTEAKETGRAVQEGWRKRKDETRFWASITITAIHDDNDTVIGYCKVTRDLTGKKKSEDNLKKSEERYHKMIAEVQDYAIILLNPDGTIENWNVGAEKIKGYSSGEIIGKSFEIFYPDEDRKNGLPQELLARARESGKAAHQGWRVRRDGTWFWGSITITALHGDDGTIIGFSKVTRDLTQQKIADDRLAAYTAELEIQKSELEQFAYVASHDLQEPLRKIQTFSDLIKQNADDREFTDRYFEKLDMSARRMSELIKSLLNYSRLAKSNESITLDEVNLNTIIKESMQDFELLIAEKNAKIITGLLPIVSGNYIQMGQLFSNLIGNALKFSRTEPVIKVNCETVRKEEIAEAPTYLIDQNYYRLTFEDNGIGFEDEYTEKIFTLFQRLHGRHDYAGTGIGLALCKKIVENHGGYITATSELGVGATFFVYLPVPRYKEHRIQNKK